MDSGPLQADRQKKTDQTLTVERALRGGEPQAVTGQRCHPGIWPEGLRETMKTSG
jgi:hypothetical protein